VIQIISLEIGTRRRVEKEILTQYFWFNEVSATVEVSPEIEVLEIANL